MQGVAEVNSRSCDHAPEPLWPRFAQFLLKHAALYTVSKKLDPTMFWHNFIKQARDA